MTCSTTCDTLCVRVDRQMDCETVFWIHRARVNLVRARILVECYLSLMLWRRRNPPSFVPLPTPTLQTTFPADEILHICKLWILYPQSVIRSSLAPLQEQLSLGWIHFLLGRMCSSVTSCQRTHYSSLGILRNAQSWTSQLIMKMWITIARPLWSMRNKHVHSETGCIPSLRMLSDIKVEATELYNTTDLSTLSAHDQDPFSPPLEEIIGRNYYQIRAC